MASHLSASHTNASLPDGWLRVDMGDASRGRVMALMSSRQHGDSLPPYAQCNLGDHVQDDPQAVHRNRAALALHMQAKPVWLTQVHGNRIVRLTHDQQGDSEALHADGAVTTEPGLACTVMVADCLPLLLAAPEGKGVAALHAGWRGLSGAGSMQGVGIVHTGVQALCDASGIDPCDLSVWLGPCIGKTQFEVGADVLMGFGVDPDDTQAHPRFKARSVHGALQPGADERKWLADLAGLARDILAELGVRSITGGTWCTASDPSRFFSYRRDGVTGRQAASICLR